ncbi:MAG: hypothetical protein K2Z81_19200, partial [Cyanobacteria bacterium]|nr:hypothetical protein [Cyanobacteriota bacterium]
MIQKKYFLPLLIAMTCLPAIANEWASREELEQKQLEVARKWQNAKQPVQPNSSYSSPTSSTITNINQIRPNSH